MHLLDLTLPSVAENLALDEALLLEAEAGSGGEVLRLWEWPAYAIVLGSGGKLAEDVDEATCSRDGVEVLRRSSGGGTVLLGRGCLVYSLVLGFERSPALREVTPSYGYILGVTSRALSGVVSGIGLAGTSDLAVAGRKVSGSSQQRKRTQVLHHGTLLYDFDFDAVGRYLRLPARQPAYRRERGHADFLTNLPVSRDELADRLRSGWGATVGLGSWPQETVARLVAEKYSRPDWTRRR